MLMNLLSKMFVFAPDDGAGSATTSGAAATGQNSGDNSGADDNANQGQSGQDDGQTQGQGQQDQDRGQDKPANVTMPRDTFNNRLEQERNAGVRTLLQGMGFEVETPEALAQAQTDMAGLITFAREQREATMTAEERTAATVETANTRATQFEQRATAAEQGRDLAQTNLRTFVLRSLIVEAAAGTPHPEDVYTWARGNQLETVDTIFSADLPLFNEDGTLNQEAIDREAVKQIITKCKEARSEWFRGVHPGVPSNAGANPPAIDPKKADKAKMAKSLIRM